jgi:hypothetical protein
VVEEGLDCPNWRRGKWHEFQGIGNENGAGKLMTAKMEEGKTNLDGKTAKPLGERKERASMELNPFGRRNVFLIKEAKNKKNNNIFNPK